MQQPERKTGILSISYYTGFFFYLYRILFVLKYIYVKSLDEPRALGANVTVKYV